MLLNNLAEDFVQQLGRGYYTRSNYKFAVPTEDRLLEQSADSVVFSSPIPSMQTAVVGFSSLHDEIGEEALEQHLSMFAYLGAPLLVTSSTDNISLYQFRGSPVAEKVDETSPTATNPELWVRDRLLDAFESSQPSLASGAGRGVLVQEIQFALSSGVEMMMRLITDKTGLSEVDSFRVAMTAIRDSFLGAKEYPHLEDHLLVHVQEFAGYLKEAVSFANIPPESIAELYERFAVTIDDRRHRGIVYTPAWLARYVVNRLPGDAFRSGSAMDPTCGSGTFLVCFLERLVDEQARRGIEPTSDLLRDAVVGVDIDPVAIETARLSLDLFCKALNVRSPQWTLSVGDATKLPILGEWIIGNLPFGYRTYEGKRDISSVILENIESANVLRRGLSLIFPDSLSYTGTASKARELLRSNYQIQEITRLPETTFPTSAAQTMVIVGRRGSSAKEVVVREVASQDLNSFRSGAYISRNYVSRFPEAVQDPWIFSPFNNAFERAEKLGIPLEKLARVHGGLQIYGSEESSLSVGSRKPVRPLLTDTSTFGAWAEHSVESLPDLVSQRHQIRRPGPWDLFDISKVIIRVTTSTGSQDRLAAIADTQGIWFTDKFAGIWPSTESIGVNAITAYLQTRFARVWFDVNNPSRKLRTRTMNTLPLPKLPVGWWKRAGALVEDNTITRPPSIQNRPKPLFGEINANAHEWEWFNSVVENAFGLEPSIGVSLEKWLLNQQESQA